MTSTSNGDDQPQPQSEASVDPSPDEMRLPARTAQPNTSLAVRQEIDEMRIIQAWGRLMGQSGFFPDAKTEAQAAVKILAGRELGFSVVASMQGFHVIDGKIVASAHIMAHAVKRSPKYDYRVTTNTEMLVEIEFFEMAPEGRVSLGTSSFSMQDAANAGLTGSRPKYEWRGASGQRERVKIGEEPGNYERFPRNMLFSRAMSNGIAWYCPDVFDVRVYTPEEIRPDLEVNAQGDIVDVDAFMPASPPPEPPRQSQAPRQQARPQQRPAAPAQPQRKTKDLAFEDVWNVQTLLTWQHEHWQGDTRAVCAVLGVENTGQIAETYGGDGEDGYRKAAELLWAHFDPESYAAHVARLLDEGVVEAEVVDAPEVAGSPQEPPVLDEALERAVDAAPSAEEPPA